MTCIGKNHARRPRVAREPLARGMKRGNASGGPYSAGGKEVGMVSGYAKARPSGPGTYIGYNAARRNPLRYRTLSTCILLAPYGLKQAETFRARQGE